MIIETTLTPWRPGLGMTAYDDAKNYLGPQITGYFVTSKHRDSGVLERSNYECILRDLQAEANNAGAPDCVTEPSFSHWAVGYVDQIVLEPDAPESVLRLAEEILTALSDYPIYNEEHYSDLERNEAADYWESLSPRNKVQYAMDKRRLCHWLAKEPVWRFGRMPFHSLTNDDSTIAEAICESLKCDQ